MTPQPVIHPPAKAEELIALERRAAQPLEAGYREFLLLTDGMEGFSVVLLGSRDWEPGGAGEAAEGFLRAVVESGTAEDVGIPPGTPLFPVAVNLDRSQGIFLIDTAGLAEERFWWTGEGDSLFFTGFAEILGYLIDVDSCDPRETLD